MRSALRILTFIWLGLVLALSGAEAAKPKHRHKPAANTMSDMAMPAAAPAPAAPKPGCEYAPIDIQKWGMKPFQNAPVIVPDTNNVLSMTLKLDYLTTNIAGCEVHLRTYNGALVGPTLRINPKTTVKVSLVNALPPDGNPCPMHHSNTPGMGFNITNLHVHGLHVSPKGNSDNVFVQVCTRGTQGPSTFDYMYTLGNAPQPPGTNWYHSHLHGSTALQVSSGAEGAIIIAGGQDNVPAIKAAVEQVMVLQEIAYNDQGVIENYNDFGNWSSMMRAITINGQIAPVITMRPGEVQYWRMIEGGVTERMPLYMSDGQGSYLPLNEIATDGNAIGHMDSWSNGQKVELDPGYRSDILFKAPLREGTYYLTTAPVAGTARLQAVLPAPGDATSNDVTKVYNEVTPAQTVLVVRVAGTPHDMALPTDAELAPYRFFKDITPGELNGRPNTVVFASGNRLCPNDPRLPCLTPCNSGDPGCANRFMVNNVPYTDLAKRELKLNTASKWTVSTDPNSGSGQHPFHIHVNPFQMVRLNPAGQPENIWKDTVLVAKGPAVELLSRYEDFDGDFVLHCHILNHEDKGMMEMVGISK